VDVVQETHQAGTQAVLKFPFPIFPDTLDQVLSSPIEEERNVAAVMYVHPKRS